MNLPREIDDDAPVPAKLRFAIAHRGCSASSTTSGCARDGFARVE